MKEENPHVTHVPVDGVLDLHTFSPKDTTSVVDEYIRVCLEKGIDEIRLIHGKGKGVLRRTIHAFLQNHPLVLNFRLDSGPSSWGVTIVRLKSPTLVPQPGPSTTGRKKL